MNLVLAVTAIFWCRAVPIAQNGDDYFSRADSIEQACEKSVRDCRRIYHECEVIFCGKGKSLAYDETDCGNIKLY